MQGGSKVANTTEDLSQLARIYSRENAQGDPHEAFVIFDYDPTKQNWALSITTAHLLSFGNEALITGSDATYKAIRGNRPFICSGVLGVESEFHCKVITIGGESQWHYSKYVFYLIILF